MNSLAPLELAVGFAGGVGIGLIYFAALWRTVRIYVDEGSLKGPFLFTIGRLILAMVGFWVLAQWSAPALLSGALGFTLARFGAQWLAGDKL